MDKKINKIRAIAYYLPQFHPIPENDEWWGKGFTEWTNVAKAKPLFKGHEQPKLPADLGFYDLRVPEVREQQAQMAREAGIEGFCYWHYWFGNGKRLLERPFNEVLESGKPDFPFMLAWANETWSGFHHGVRDSSKILIEQFYPGEEDIINHFNICLPAFKDKRYIKVGNMPCFMIYHYWEHPEIEKFIKIWNLKAKENDIDGIFFIAMGKEVDIKNAFDVGFNGYNIQIYTNDVYKNTKNYWWIRQFNRIRKLPLQLIDYKYFVQTTNSHNWEKEHVYPTAMPNWDHTPRTGKKGVVYNNSTPELFMKHLHNIHKKIKEKENENFLFIKSWNEWAEGNYLEPDVKWGKQYLLVLKDVLRMKKND